MMVCDGCTFTIREVVLLSTNNERVKEFLINHGLIKESTVCPTCQSEVKVNWDYKQFRCQKSYTVNKTKQKCAFKRSVFKESFFSNVHLSVETVLQFVAYWVTLNPPRQKLLMSELNIAEPTVVDWQSFSREVCIFFMERNQEKIGGEGEVVEIDEAKVGKRKYHRGRAIEGQWVFGGILRSDPSKCFLKAVPDRTRDTLLGVLNDFVLPGTTIYSDCWKSYDSLDEAGFPHFTVNHSENFVDPTTGTHTQNIERLWRDMRFTVPRFGRSKDHYDGYLAEFAFKRAFPVFKERFHQFFKLAAESYPPVA